VSSDDYKKQQDLIFQEIFEKGAIRDRTVFLEWFSAMEKRAKRHRVFMKVVRMMVNDGKTYDDVDAYLDALDQKWTCPLN
jgi:hypothetical protein